MVSDLPFVDTTTEIKMNKAEPLDTIAGKDFKANKTFAVSSPMTKDDRIVVAIYNHPEFYPPTLNAVQLLAARVKEVTIVSRNVLKSGWIFPGNVHLKLTGEYIHIRQSERQSFVWKTLSFLKFSFMLLKMINITKPKVVLIFDPFPLLSYRLFKLFMKGKHLLWYHNHDVSQPGLNRKLSIGALVEKNEPRMFKRIDIFSLPAMDRLKYFPLETFKGKFFFIPNYPSVDFYRRFYKEKKPLQEQETIRIIFQGSIGSGHGIEEMITALNNRLGNRGLLLVLKGFIKEDYKHSLVKLATDHKVLDKVQFVGITPYQEVPALASTCHIGIGIHMASDRMNATLGTASNKIYEYAALGLPVLAYDNAHFRAHLGKYQWVFFTDCTQKSLMSAVESIIVNYEALSKQAHFDFMHALNFECYFNKVSNYLENLHAKAN